MLTRINGRNYPSASKAPRLAAELEREGHCILRGVFDATEVAALRDEVMDVYRRVPAEMRDSAITPEVGEMYRYQMFNHSALCQKAIARREILEVLEPLLGADCHVISCTSWNNPPGNALTPNGLQWHIDGGPHVPRPDDTEWPAHIAYPVFIVATHIYLQYVRIEDGPTSCIPKSHTSGRVPPDVKVWDLDLHHAGQQPSHHLVKAGDVDFRVSDVWHRRWPPAEDSNGRLFLQTNYGRRDIAQRVLPTSEVNHATKASLERARDDRERCLLGLHPQGYFDA